MTVLAEVHSRHRHDYDEDCLRVDFGMSIRAPAQRAVQVFTTKDRSTSIDKKRGLHCGARACVEILTSRPEKWARLLPTETSTVTFALPVYDHTVSPVTPVIQTRLNWSRGSFPAHRIICRPMQEVDKQDYQHKDVCVWMYRELSSRGPIHVLSNSNCAFPHEHQHCMNATRNPMDRQVWNFLLGPNIAKCDSSSHQCRGTFAMHSSDKKKGRDQSLCKKR